MIVGRHGDGRKVRVAAPPEDGKANAAVLALLADTPVLPRASVTLVSGGGLRDKVIEVSGLTVEEAERRLEALG